MACCNGYARFRDRKNAPRCQAESAPEYDEYFLHAEYDRPADMIDDFEEAAFRSALSRAERLSEINDLDSWEILRGLHAVSASEWPRAIWPRSVVQYNSSMGSWREHSKT